MNDQPMSTETTSPPVGPYTLPPLKFAYDALEPAIDAATMRLHHDKHHQGYVDKVNGALEKHPEWLGLTIEEVLRRLNELPEDIRQTVRNQGGGHANHLDKVRVVAPFVGGGFGSQCFTWPHAVMAAFAAHALGVPVRIVLSHAQVHLATGCRQLPITRRQASLSTSLNRNGALP